MKNTRIVFAILAAALVFGMTACFDDDGIEVFVTGVTLNTKSISLARGATANLKATVAPSDATNKAVVWRSSDDTIATVSKDGVVAVASTAVIGQTAIITVYTEDGRKNDYCAVIVSSGGIVPVTGVSLKTSTSLVVGGTETLSPSITPSDATNKNVTWVSSAPAVATVSSAGTVTALAVGTATITATAVSDSTKKATCTVTVRANAVPVESISLNKVTLPLDAGNQETLIAKIEPSDATNQNVRWDSSALGVAFVSDDGTVTAISGGTATITATAADTTNGKITATCEVTVTVPVSGVTLNKPSTSLAPGGTETLTATVAPATATIKTVTWTSSDTTVATVATDGKVTATSKGGTAIITVTADGDKTKTATCAVTVNVPVTGVTLNKPSTSILMGSYEILFPKISPDNATNKNVTWESTIPTVATVSETGEVTALTVGTTTIRVTTVNGGISAYCTVTVSNVAVPVTSVTLDRTTIGTGNTPFYVGADPITLTAAIEPSNATNQNVRWTSDNLAVATVENGVVTGVGSGTAKITATAFDNPKYFDTCSVMVKVVPVSGVKLAENLLIPKIGDTVTLTATLIPSNAIKKTVQWTNSDNTVATITTNDLTATVTAIAAKSTTITVTVDGIFSARCTVTVAIPVTGITLNKRTLSLEKNAPETLIATVAPPTATNKKVTWKSSNDKIATVSDGLVTAKDFGTATITVTADDNTNTNTNGVNFFDQCTVTVRCPVTGVTLNKSATKILVGSKDTLTATVSPSEATNKNVTWESSDDTIATVSANGLNASVTAVKKGTATITATAVDDTNKKKAICEVTVPVTYTVTFDSKGGFFNNNPEEGIITKTVEEKTKVDEPTKPKKSEDTFNGWYSDLNSQTQYNFKTQDVTRNITLSAKWIPKVEMVSITGGEFSMGSPNATPPWPINEQPQHNVRLSDFKMGKYEVTQELYEAVMGTNPSYFQGTRKPTDWEVQEQRPVEQVSWYDAIVFCNKLSIAEGKDPAYKISGETDPIKWGAVPAPSSNNATWDAVTIITDSNGYRLPTEAQWEYACRAGTTTAFNTGDTAGINTGWYGPSTGALGNSDSRTHQVGLKLANNWGLYDMHGNVYEWCWDWYKDNAYNTGQQIVDPTGPDSGTARVRRGGCYDQVADHMRSAYRSSNDVPTNNNSKVGFRVVLPLPKEK